MYLGGKEIKECPHKTVSRFYDSPQSPVPQWRCDWCGQDFAPAVSASKIAELSEQFQRDNGIQVKPSSVVVADFTPEDSPIIVANKSVKKKEKSLAS